LKPVIDMFQTGCQIEKLMLEKGLTVKDLQRYFGFATPQAIYKWKYGDCLPSLDNLVVLAKLFHVKMDDIIILKGEYEK